MASSSRMDGAFSWTCTLWRLNLKLVLVFPPLTCLSSANGKSVCVAGKWQLFLFLLPPREPSRLQYSRDGMLNGVPSLFSTFSSHCFAPNGPFFCFVDHWNALKKMNDFDSRTRNLFFSGKEGKEQTEGETQSSWRWRLAAVEQWRGTLFFSLAVTQPGRMNNTVKKQMVSVSPHSKPGPFVPSSPAHHPRLPSTALPRRDDGVAGVESVPASLASVSQVS